jgi:signal transduction histidine kinase
MLVQSLDGIAVVEPTMALARARRATAATLADVDGRIISATVARGRISRPPLRTSLYVLAAVYASLGAVVVLRRADLAQAQWFAAFAGLGALAIAVAPAAGGAHAPWALALQFVVLAALAAVLPPFVLALRGDDWGPRSRFVCRLLLGLTTLVVAAYALAVAQRPQWYAAVRLAWACLIGFSLVGSTVLLVRRAVSSRRRDADPRMRLVLIGLASGTLPFVALTLVPLAVWHRPVVAAHWTALCSAAIPVTFAIAVVRQQLFGIRRLLHRGIVYGAATIVLFLAVTALSAIVSRYVPGAVESAPWLVGLLVVVSVALFSPLHRALNHVSRRYLAWGDVDYRSVFDSLSRNLGDTTRVQATLETLIGRIAQSLRVEAACLLLAPDFGPNPTIAVGPRAQEVLDGLRDELGELARDGGLGPREYRWRSDVLLVTPLVASSRCLGTLVWGPKVGGEVFVAEERRLLATVSPILALVLLEFAQAERLQELSARLLETGEEERARLARELHDGPLQRAVFLSADLTSSSGPEVARELVTELREVCARLRPAILDDLGLVAALDWLASRTSRQHRIETRIDLEHLDVEDRLEPEVELALFRVAQEALNNAVKHARARRARITIKRSGGRVYLEVEDDGVGFSPSDTRGTGLGFLGMNERVRQIRGVIRVSSSPGEGTRVVVEAPLGESHDG